MAAPAKSSSRWGSFLSQAVAGVESRLDNMLEGTDDAQSQLQRQQQDQPQQQPQQQPQAQAPMSAATPSPQAGKASPSASSKPSPAASRSSSNTRANANDRLQARLAKAMAAKNQSGGADHRSAGSPRSSVDTANRNSVDRLSMDAQNEDKKGPISLPETHSESPSKPQTPTIEESVVDSVPLASPAEQTKVQIESPQPTLETPSKEDASSEAEAMPYTRLETQPNTTTANNEATALVLAKANDSKSPESNIDIEAIQTQHQEEIQEYVERIDSLQSKLQYLSKKATESAKKATQAAQSGTTERKLAEKDEKIALLLEEGQKLSSTEHKLRMVIKKLRLQIGEQEKQTESLKKSVEKAEADTEALRNRLTGDEAEEKRQEETRNAMASLQKEIDLLKKERTAKNEAMNRLEQDLKAKAESSAAASVEAHNKMLAAEQEKRKQLEDTVASLKADSDSLANKHRLETVEWAEKLNRAQERARTLESESKLELLSMENKLEAMRSAAEEAASGAGGEGQVNLIRQIETLQSQYATASSNWQGIEASLLAKVSNLEKEKDEAQRRESEMRKKARDAASRCRRLEDEVQDLQPALTNVKQELEACREELAPLRASLKDAEAALSQARADLEKQQRVGAVTRGLAGEPEKPQWPDEMLGSLSRTQSRPDSPLLSVSRTMSGDLAGFQIPSKARRTPLSDSRPDSPADGFSLSRRMSSQPFGRLSALSPAGSSIPPMPFSPFEPPSESHIQSPSLAERDDPTDDRIPSSPRQVAQDMISVSTAGAGPSVQLVERMSAAIRRLEGEKVAAKEEMARVCSQRDEARSDMVQLMKDIDASKSAMNKVPELEKELKDLHSRYQTTLELLGEKSELVEELKADVQDVKAMYRELVERTVK